ncbi:MAG: glycoside hydrolase family 30 beta sandwich domain-containing protein [Mucinivorans sp.]
MYRKISLLVLSLALISCGGTKYELAEWRQTSQSSPWQDCLTDRQPIAPSQEQPQRALCVHLDDKQQVVEGFGACFNELGWSALSDLKASDRDQIMRELFEAGVGANFNICRMPIGANDFSLSWYSYDETPGDFDLTDFSIEHDQQNLIPFIQTALKYNPELRIWASPWSPPTWMKSNNYYACRPSAQWNKLAGDESYDSEGVDLFIQKPEYLEAYARYFSKFIQAYRAEGITVFAVAPQNEFNSCQIFPSCTWTARGLNDFVGKYLGPQMTRDSVQVILGTVERGNVSLIDTLLTDQYSKKYISWVGFQWAGKHAIEQTHEKYPDLRLIQTESECGDGLNDWTQCVYIWDLMKHYFDCGASVYEYWNIALLDDAISTWGWHQNSLVTVDKQAQSYKYNNEYYLMKHLSRYVQRGARRVMITDDQTNSLAFENPDGSVVVALYNSLDRQSSIKISVADQNFETTMDAESFNTLVFRQI